MAKKQNILPYHIFVGDRPWEAMTQEEKESFGQEAAQRMGRELNDYFSQNPEAYKKF